MVRDGDTSCEPTYKELKRLFPGSELSRAFGCEPTYKELKHIRVIQILNFLPIRCEPTYKELKQINLLLALLSRALLRAYL